MHATHPQVLNRLKRADGHLHNVLTMLGDNRPCLDIVQQLHAVEKALQAAKKTLIHDHINHCLTAANKASRTGARRDLEEFQRITKYL